MRNSSKYLKLWQQKRSELQIGDDPQTGWLEMQALLDEHLPITQPVNLYTDEKLAHLVKYKWLYLLAAALVAALIIYFTLHQPIRTKTDKVNKTKLEKDSVVNSRVNKPARSINVAPDSTAINTEINPLVINGMPDKSSTNGVKVSKSAAITSDSIDLAGKAANSNDRSEAKYPAEAFNHKAIKPGSNNKITNVSSSNAVISNRLSAVNKSNSFRLKHHENKPGLFNRQTPAQVVMSHSLPVRGNNQLTGSGKTGDRNKYGSQDQVDISGKLPVYQLQLSPPKLNFNWSVNTSLSIAIKSTNNKITEKMAAGKSLADKKVKQIKINNSKASGVDWGILAGINLPGSFTPKNQNANIYGSLPVDVFLGAFVTYNLNNKWGIGSQVRLLNPHTVSGSYTHINQSKIDTNQTLQINDSRKIYTIDIPLHLSYNVTNNLSFKAGPVISIPVKQVTGSSSFQTSKARKDTTTYYSTVTGALNNTGFEKKINYGISGGVTLHVNRLLFDATYYRGLQTQKVSSALGSYTANTNGLQLTIGFKLNKTKR
ncbi:MAG: hypothetical protein JWQ79_1048 [Mucilaginibacter sp.]|nr:hypothetical protein [Mucilaginibacter sp.]